MASTSVVSVRTSARVYDVCVGSGTLDSLGAHARRTVGARSARAFLAFDRGLPSTTVDAARASLASAGFVVTAAPVAASEVEKSLLRVHELLVALATSRHERADPVIALGGGITGDVAGFAASIYRRGVPVIQCPTTLLAMVDASVGGKTGVNLLVGDHASALKKNLVGAFHQPVSVIADVSVLRSLSPRHMRSGLAECVKHGLISAHASDDSLLDWTEANLSRIMANDDETLVEMVTRHVRVKASIVGDDEFEMAPSSAGGRALLNLGHTFGHAIETMPALSPDSDPSHAPLHHGEAVALGLIAALHASKSLGLLTDPTLTSRVAALLESIGLPTSVHGLPDTAVIRQAMGDDKKVSGGHLRLVLPIGGARATIVEAPDERAVATAIDSIRAS